MLCTPDRITNGVTANYNTTHTSSEYPAALVPEGRRVAMVTYPSSSGSGVVACFSF